MVFVLLRRGLSNRGLLDSTNIMLVSDHGMANEEHAISLADYIDLSLVRVWLLVAFIVPLWSSNCVLVRES